MRKEDPIETVPLLGRFVPLLAGGSLRDRLVACMGAVAGLLFVAMTCSELFPASMPWIVAPIGASAVLIFAVPASPLAQPWSIVGGNGISALAGLLVVAWVREPVVAAPLAVSAAILVMSLARCLHPPGGAVALGMVLAGRAPELAHLAQQLVPVLVNSALLVGIGWAFHRYSGHSYPHRPVPAEWKALPADAEPRLQMEDIDAALDELGETFDVSREDLLLLLARAEVHAAARTGMPLPKAGWGGTAHPVHADNDTTADDRRGTGVTEAR